MLAEKLKTEVIKVIILEKYMQAIDNIKLISMEKGNKKVIPG